MSEPLTPEERVRAALQYLRGFPRQIGPFEWAWSPDKRGAYVPFEDAVDAFLTTLAGASEGLVLVRAGTGGVLPDGTTNHPDINFDEGSTLATLDAARTGASEELDVERLIGALRRVDEQIVAAYPETAVELLDGDEKGRRDYAEAIAREYAALASQSDAGLVGATVDEVLAANPAAVADFQAGKVQAVGFLVGQVMKATRGQADAGLVQATVRERLERSAR